MDDIKVFTRDQYPLLKEIQKQIPERYGIAYVIEYGDFVKIGCTSKPHNRLANLRYAAENYGNCELGRIAILPCCRNFGVVEGYLHNLFSDSRKKRTELFGIKFDNVLKEISKHEINYRSKIEIKIIEKVREDKPKAIKEKGNRELYWIKRINELEQRIEKLEAQTSARAIDPTNDSETYSISEFASALRVSRLTISRRIKNGTIQAFKIGRNWKIPKTELQKIFEA